MVDRKRISCVIGGTSGIGRGVVENFLIQGHIVYAIGRGQQHAQELQKAHKKNSNLTIITGDICKEDFQKDIQLRIEQSHGKLDILVNSAGKLILSDQGGGINEPLTVWRDSFEINLFSVASTIKNLYPLLKKGQKASIVNISSVCSLYPFDSCTSNAYSVSKTGLDMLTKRLAQQLAADKIRVNAVNPGVVHSNIMNSANLSVQQQKAFKDKILEKRHPLGRLGNPEDVAHAVAYLSSREADWVTGTILSVDGGYSVS